jgi:hypothetical protein
MFGVQKPIVRSSMDPLCRKMVLLSFIDPKDVSTFVTYARILQKKKIGLNTGVLENEHISWAPMQLGDRWMLMDSVKMPFSEIENMCMIHYLDLIIVREMTTKYLQGIEVTYDLPPPSISIRVLNRLYHV